MKINIYIIEKKSNDKIYAQVIEHFQKVSKPYAKIEVIRVFDKGISKAQELSPTAAQRAYTKALDKYIVKNSINIALDPSAKEVDSHEFADLLKDSTTLNFFIGGAFGFERDFLVKCNHVISFGKITLSHKLAQVVLVEQIFRGLTINHNHPYHK